MKLIDYKVRILEESEGADRIQRWRTHQWLTLSTSTNIIDWISLAAQEGGLRARDVSLRVSAAS